MVNFINVADLKNPKTGKTYRQENRELRHNIPLNSIVELLPYGNTPEDDYNEHTGLRLFVVGHARDCDGTPLYTLSFLRKEAIDEERNTLMLISGDEGKVEFVINHRLTTGHAEENLKLIKAP